jgi:lysophospholipase L1-like esterase
VSGDTTYHLIERFYSTVVSEEFDWAVLFIGTNDCRELDDDAHISNISLDEYKRNMRYLMKSLLDRGKTVVNVTIPYVDNLRLRQMFTENNQRYDDTRIDRTNDFIRELSREHKTHLADLAEAIKKFGNDVLEEDGIHMNSHGHMLLCGLLWDILL